MEQKKLAELAQQELDEIGTQAQLMGLEQHFIDMIATCVRDMYDLLPAGTVLSSAQQGHKALLDQFLQHPSIDLSKVGTDPIETNKMQTAFSVRTRVFDIMDRYLRAFFKSLK